MKKLISIALCILLVFSFVACTQQPPVETGEPPVETEPGPVETEPAEETDPNVADYTYVQPKGETFDINGYYNPLGVECDVAIRQKGGVVSVPDVLTTELPKAKENYTIGFSVYYTVDEVGAMLVETMKAAADAAGVKLLINDANYEQNKQDQAIEQWIVDGVDGVILAPCDFAGVKGSLDALKEANIPVVTLNPPLAGEADAIIMAECVEQGAVAGKILLDYLKANNVEMKGTIIYQTLPFVHPNAATRAKGFKDTFKDYPDVKIVELTGVSPEEHYTAFEGALAAHDDIIGAFGLYSSATIGMMNAREAAKSTIPLTSIDNDKPILAGIKEGKILGSACYSSSSPANWCMSAIVNILNGVEVPSAFFYPTVEVKADNVEEMFEFYYAGKKLADYIANPGA